MSPLRERDGTAESRKWLGGIEVEQLDACFGGIRIQTVAIGAHPDGGRLREHRDRVLREDGNAVWVTEAARGTRVAKLRLIAVWERGNGDVGYADLLPFPHVGVGGDVQQSQRRRILACR